MSNFFNIGDPHKHGPVVYAKGTPEHEKTVAEVKTKKSDKNVKKNKKNKRGNTK